MCMFLTILYAGFAGLTFAYSKSVMEELVEDEREDAMKNSRNSKNPTHFVGGYDGYIGDRFDVRRNGGTPGFVAPNPDKQIL
jgi:hypothetical protein